MRRIVRNLKVHGFTWCNDASSHWETQLDLSDALLVLPHSLKTKKQQLHMQPFPVSVHRKHNTVTVLFTSHPSSKEINTGFHNNGIRVGALWNKRKWCGIH